MDGWFLLHKYNHPPWVIPQAWWFFCCWHLCGGFLACSDLHKGLFLGWCCLAVGPFGVVALWVFSCCTVTVAS